jgi:hypothetical protein
MFSKTFLAGISIAAATLVRSAHDFPSSSRRLGWGAARERPADMG